MNLSHRRKKRPTNKGLEPFSPSLVRARERGRGRRGRGRRLPFLSLPINHPDFSSARLTSYEIVRTRDPRCRDPGSLRRRETFYPWEHRLFAA